MQAPYECEVCGVRFAKAAKREAHLLDVHGARIGLSPRALSPAAPGSVTHAVNRALANANAAFASSKSGASSNAVTCSFCPCSVTSTFKNPRDLAQHILSKHDNFLDDCSAVSHMPPPAKRAKLDSDSSFVQTSSRQILKGEAKPVPSANKPPLSPKSSDRGPSPSNSAPAGSMSRSVSVSASGSAVASSGSSKKNKRSVAVDANNYDDSARKERSCAQSKARDNPASITMDFAAIVGFTTNARKSYYRLSNR